jgi:hypothetical protein
MGNIQNDTFKYVNLKRRLEQLRYDIKNENLVMPTDEDEQKELYAAIKKIT